MSFCPYLRLWKKEMHQSWVRCNPTPTCVMFRVVKCIYQGMDHLHTSRFQLKGCQKTRRRSCLCKPCQFQISQGPSISLGPLFLQINENCHMHVVCLICVYEHFKEPFSPDEVLWLPARLISASPKSAILQLCMSVSRMFSALRSR